MNGENNHEFIKGEFLAKLLDHNSGSDFKVLDDLAATIKKWNIHQGFWGSENKSEKLMLVVTELAEACEAIRGGDAEGEAEELADTLIRVLDYCGYFNIRIGDAVLNKLMYNASRGFRHGKKF